MSITIDSDLQRDIEEKQESCMCAQMAEKWSDFQEGFDTPEIRDNLRQEANPNCHYCKGTGIETVSHEVGAPTINLSNRNARVLFSILGLDVEGEEGYVGEMTIPEARRAVMRAQSRQNIAKFVQPETKVHGKPREVSPGVYDMKPLKMYDAGLTEEQLHAYIRRFAEFVVEVSRLGATKIFWS
jgi:hypothetical protein